MNTLCFSIALANTRAFDDNSGYPRPVLVPRVDRLMLHKGRRRLQLMSQRHVVRTFRIALDARASVPVGRYVVADRLADSPFHLALRLVPRLADLGRGKALQLHGTPDWLGPLAAALHGSDWTTGGIGLANADIEDLWNLVEDGTRVVVRP